MAAAPPPPVMEQQPQMTAEQAAYQQQQLTPEQAAFMAQQQQLTPEQAAFMAQQQQQQAYYMDPGQMNPYYAAQAYNPYAYYGGPMVPYFGQPQQLLPADQGPQRTRRRRRGSARGRRGGRREGENGEHPADEDVTVAESPAFSAADFPSLGGPQVSREPTQQWVTPVVPEAAPPAEIVAVAQPPAAAKPVVPHKPKDPSRRCGVCAWFEPSKKMGFLKQDEGGDIFVHASDLREGVTIEEGDRVEYAVAKFKDRNKAINVVLISQILAETPIEDESDGQETPRKTAVVEVPVFDDQDFPSLGGPARVVQQAAWGAAVVPAALTGPPAAPVVPAKRPVTQPPPSPPRAKPAAIDEGEKKDQATGSQRKTGVCLWYILKKRHGFIKPNEGGASDIFVHASDLRDGAIEEGDSVEYAVAKFKDRVKAVDVTVLASAAPASAV